MNCDGCTECCELLEIDSKRATEGKLIEAIQLDSPAGQLCNYCDRNIGCTVWEERPTICRTFECTYRQLDGLHEELRPDRCGVIFEKIDDSLFIGTINPKKGISEVGMKQIGKFKEQGYTTVLFRPDRSEYVVNLSDGHSLIEIENRIKELREEYGRSTAA